jgi:hypothetical protein
MKYLNQTEMIKIRIKSAEFIHKQLVKDKKLPPGSTFNAAGVDVSDIGPGMFYGGFTYVNFN